MQLATFNIQSGGFTDYSYDLAAPVRLSDIQAAVARVNADLIGLLDTWRWRQLFSDDQLLKLFGYPTVYCINMECVRVEPDVGITVFTRLPGVKFERLWLGTRYAVKAMVPLGDTILQVYIAYLDDMSEATRLQQMEAIVADANLCPALPAAIMGDLNTLKPLRMPLIPRMSGWLLRLPGVRSIKNVRAVSFREVSRGRVVPRLQQAGFTDALNGTQQPTFFKPVGPFTLALALDQVWIRGVTTADSHIWDEPQVRPAADHVPVSVQLIGAH